MEYYSQLLRHSFVCSWVAIHPNIPPRSESSIRRFLGHLMIMHNGLYALYPWGDDLFYFISCSQFCNALLITLHNITNLMYQKLDWTWMLLKASLEINAVDEREWNAITYTRVTTWRWSLHSTLFHPMLTIWIHHPQLSTQVLTAQQNLFIWLCLRARNNSIKTATFSLTRFYPKISGVGYLRALVLWIIAL